MIEAIGTTRKIVVSKVSGMSDWSTLGPVSMIMSGDGSVELIAPSKTVTVRDGKKLARLFGRYETHMTDGNFKGAWNYGAPDGGPADHTTGRAQHFLTLEITLGERTYPATNPTRAGQTYISRQTLVMRASTAYYHGDCLTKVIRRL